MTTPTNNNLINIITVNALKVTVIASLLFAIQPQPYNYYQILRVIICLLFAMIGANEYKNKRAISCALCWGCTLIFQPIKHVELSRYSWVIIDQLLIGVLIMWIIIDLVIFFRNRKLDLSKK